MILLNIFVMILLHHNIIFTQASLNDKRIVAKHQNNDSVSDCVTRIFNKEIPLNSIVFVVSSNNYHNTLLRSINVHYHFSVITRSFAKQKWLVYPNVYLISVKNSHDLLTGIDLLSKDLSWNPTAKFLIIFKNLKNDESEKLEVFNMLLRKFIINIVLITTSKDNDFELLTYYPYSGSNCGRNASDIRSLGYCRNLNDTSLFPDKVPNGLRNCTISVVAREYPPYVITENSNYSKYLNPGIEQYVFNLLAKQERFNFNLTYIDPKEGFGVVLPNDTITGLLGYLRNDTVSIILGGLFILKNRIECFDFIYGYNYALFSIFTPVLQEQKWTRAYRQFSSTTWLLILISFVFATIIIIKTLSVTSGPPKDKVILVLKLWRYFYGQVDNELFRHKYLQRIMLVWILFTNCICAFYNTALYSLITGHVQNQIRINPNDLSSLPFKACINDQVRTFFKFAYNETFPIGDTNPDCQRSITAFQRVASRSDLYNIDTDYAYFFSGSKYVHSEGRHNVLKKWDYPRNLVFSIYMKKGFPLRHKLQERALNIYETGLLQRHLINVLGRNRNAVPLSKKYSPIQLEDLIIHFSILIVGAFVSLVCFLIELNIVKKKIY